jgi:hypothetical protein
MKIYGFFLFYVMVSSIIALTPIGSDTPTNPIAPACSPGEDIPIFP